MENQERVGAEGEQQKLFKPRRGQLPDAERVRVLQGKLYQKAKQERKYKFYVLYDKIFLPYVLRQAWESVKKNGGSPGIDGQTIEDVGKSGEDAFLEELKEDLRKRTYKPKAVKRVMIPKANGGERPLGIPTVRDRVAQTACKMIIEPLFEADFEESSHGFRPGRSAKDAMASIKQHLQEGKTEVLDADLSSYFDTIPHDKLMIALKERIADPRVLNLIQLWLKAPVYEDGQFKGGRNNDKGTPQGGVISPLLANIYLHLLDRIVNNPRSLFKKLGIKMVRYADDFVLLAQEISEEATLLLRQLLDRMGLRMNEEKTRLLQVRESSFDFLGFTIRYSRDLYKRNHKYLDIHPSKKSEKRVRRKISDYLATHGHCSGNVIAQELNVIIKGWLNYFDIKEVSYMAMSRRRLRHYLLDKLRRFYRRKSQRKSSLHGQQAFEKLVRDYGLIDPTKLCYD